MTKNISNSNNVFMPRVDDDIANFLSKISNKYSGNAEQKNLNQMYDIGILIANKKFNKDKLIQKLTKIIEEKSNDPIKQIRDAKKISFINALKQGISDGMSDEYRYAYDSSNRYQYIDREKLKKRAIIDSVLNNFDDISGDTFDDINFF